LTNGVNNITNEPPLFVNTNAFNFRLTMNSPCINRGTNRSWMINGLDLDGHGRIDKHYGSIVDMGAYEFVPNGTLFMGQ
jgi:hypothetical protein